LFGGLIPTYTGNLRVGQVLLPAPEQSEWGWTWRHTWWKLKSSTKVDFSAPICRCVADDCWRERSCAVPLVCGGWLLQGTVLLVTFGCVWGRGHPLRFATRAGSPSLPKQLISSGILIVGFWQNKR